MSASIIDGKAIAAELLATVKQRVSQRQADNLPVPGLAVVKVGDNPASEVYVRNKHRACKEAGINSISHDLDANTTQTELLQLIDCLNNNPEIHGILVQLPLPQQIDPYAVIETINPDKDVDGFHPDNIGRLALGKPRLRPCTPYGIIKLLQHTGASLRGLEAVVVGSSNIVGKPMALELIMAGCTVTVCNSATRELATHVSRADIIVAAVGKPSLIKGSWIKAGAIIIDVGITRQQDGSLAGDVEFEAASENAAWITPVPGGVGPMTVAMLLHNTLDACEHLDA
ncbi:MAG: bifunctional methylenetetrahydrofolate dehydrogenase/methenyltetrahydrofolate cyclohydrolase FolD [Gammaproteobacteria bacterium]|nr:MAG: bifunctional methylenetetrahydrofolate dehydrogenase/methenyltetrahydrofolate cyclohydrolase FolD [Gammaproteobacteria bacterium]